MIRFYDIYIFQFAVFLYANITVYFCIQTDT